MQHPHSQYLMLNVKEFSPRGTDSPRICLGKFFFWSYSATILQWLNIKYWFFEPLVQSVDLVPTFISWPICSDSSSACLSHNPRYSSPSRLWLYSQFLDWFTLPGSYSALPEYPHGPFKLAVVFSNFGCCWYVWLSIYVLIQTTTPWMWIVREQ